MFLYAQPLGQFPAISGNNQICSLLILKIIDRTEVWLGKEKKLPIKR
jgi:hypothetical protein